MLKVPVDGCWVPLLVTSDTDRDFRKILEAVTTAHRLYWCDNKTDNTKPIIKGE